MIAVLFAGTVLVSAANAPSAHAQVLPPLGSPLWCVIIATGCHNVRESCIDACTDPATSYDCIGQCNNAYNDCMDPWWDAKCYHTN